MMNKESYAPIIIIAVVVVVVLGGWLFISNSSGVNPPFTVIESHSMQHCQEDDRHSELGVIDTGDMVLVKSKDKCDIVSYVDGSKTGYKTFGDYGNVIVYYRDSGNPVIHRAFLWLQYNGDGTWSAPSLEGYARYWECSTGTTDYNNLSGTLTFKEVGIVVEGGKNLTINLSNLPHTSGFLTVGDSVSNTYFDQSTSISSSLVSMEKIKSVAWKEIPWLGSIKLMLNGHTSELNNWASNSKTMIAELIVTMILVVIAAGCLIDEIRFVRHRSEEDN